jgi:uroporphyrinogen-III synthase
LSGTVLILRPEPGATASAARARAIGLTPVVAPLFDVVPLAWSPPAPGRHDAIFLTSAHAPRLAGGGLAALRMLPTYAVGEATAEAARGAGFADVRTGPADGAALLALAAADGIRNALHLCGRDHLPLRHPDLQVEPREVYAAVERDGPLDIPLGAVALLHSPRAATLFARRVAARAAIRLAAISPATAAAAGEGWAAVGVAAEPRDEAVLEVARLLCQSGGPDAAGAGS